MPRSDLGKNIGAQGFSKPEIAYDAMDFGSNRAAIGIDKQKGFCAAPNATTYELRAIGMSAAARNFACMTTPIDEYRVRASAYRLLAALPGDPKRYREVVDATMADPLLRDTINYLTGIALGGFVRRNNGDMAAALAEVDRELRAAEDLSGMSGSDSGD